MGEGTAWLLGGMDRDGRLVTWNSTPPCRPARGGSWVKDPRVTFVSVDGGSRLEEYEGKPFDLAVADTWPGEFTHLEQALGLVAPGGVHLIDDHDPQSGRPEGHEASVARLLAELEGRKDFRSVRPAWASGLLTAVRATP